MPYALHMLRFSLLAFAFSVPTLAAQGSSSSGDLKLFAPLVGKCFIAKVGPNSTDGHCFEAVYGGGHVRDRHRVVVDGKIVYGGETIYSRSGDEVVFTYINTLGGVGHGKAQAIPAGIIFTGSMRGAPSSPPQSMDSTWRWQGAGYVAGDGKGADVIFRPVPAK